MFGRPRKIPVQLRPPLERDERVLAWARPAVTSSVPSVSAALSSSTPAGGRSEASALVATNRGLWLPEAEPRRLSWSDIHKAAWSGRDLEITPAAVVAVIDEYVVMADEPPLRYTLADPGEIPDQVRARVTRSVAYTVHHVLVGGGGVRIVARRVPGMDGLRWAVRYDSGADLGDPLVREMTLQLVVQARAQTAADR